MKYKRLSAEDEKAFLQALSDIWSEVGYDCLACTAMEKGFKEKRTDYGHLAPAEQITMRRSTVIDIATDTFAGSGNRHMPEEQFKRIRQWMMATPGHIVDKVAAKEFTAKWYGA